MINTFTTLSDDFISDRKWSSSGITTLSLGGTFTHCQSNHLTSFAILLVSCFHYQLFFLSRVFLTSHLSLYRKFDFNRNTMCEPIYDYYYNTYSFRVISYLTI